METPYTYVFVREDLSQAQQVVQACHACLRRGLDTPESTHLVLVGVKDEDALVSVAKTLQREGVWHRVFFEPDPEDNPVGRTSIVTGHVYGQARELFRRWRLKE